MTAAEKTVTAIVATSSPAGNGTPVLSLQPQKAKGTVRTATNASILRTDSRTRESITAGVSGGESSTVVYRRGLAHGPRGLTVELLVPETAVH
jgi:hypothetical protein